MFPTTSNTFMGTRASLCILWMWYRSFVHHLATVAIPLPCNAIPPPPSVKPPCGDVKNQCCEQQEISWGAGSRTEIGIGLDVRRERAVWVWNCPTLSVRRPGLLLIDFGCAPIASRIRIFDKPCKFWTDFSIYKICLHTRKYNAELSLGT